MEAVRSHGGRVIVVTSKLGRLAHLHLDHLKLVADEVVGELFAEGKTAALTRYGARVYAGDHVADMLAARTAGVPGIGVTTGPCSRASLEAAGAAEVLDDLRGFPAALDRLLRIAW
jgi:phosphoglycolate phosphatase